MNLEDWAKQHSPKAPDTTAEPVNTTTSTTSDNRPGLDVTQAMTVAGRTMIVVFLWMTWIQISIAGLAVLGIATHNAVFFQRAVIVETTVERITTRQAPNGTRQAVLNVIVDPWENGPSSLQHNVPPDQSFAVGDRIRIAYDPQNPRNTRLAHVQDQMIFWFAGGSLAMLISILLLLKLLRTERSKTRNEVT